jgi:hypothetical protein
MKSGVVDSAKEYIAGLILIYMGNPFAGYDTGIKECPGKNAEIWFNF